MMYTAPNSTLAKDGVIRIGIIGCDTSHVIAFTNLINDRQATGPFAKAEVTAAYPGGSPDIPASKDRLPGYVKELRERGIKIVDTLDELAGQTDAILLESYDGRPHLEQFRAVAKGKPVFVDKPIADSLAGVIALYRVAEETHTPVFSASTLRYCKEVQEAATPGKSIGKIIGCETAGPLKYLPHHPDLFFYGIHGVEPLYTIMGPGCESVSCTDSPTSTIVVGKWKDGRLGTYRGLKNSHDYAFTTYGDKGIVHSTGFSGYDAGVTEICNFLVSGKPPVSRDETIEIYTFMQAADESKRLGGKAVALQDVIQAAERKAPAAN